MLNYSSANSVSRAKPEILLCAKGLNRFNSLPNDKIWSVKKLKEFAENNFKFDQIMENTGKRRNCSL